MLDHDGGKEKENKEPDGEQQGMARESMTGWDKTNKGRLGNKGPERGTEKREWHGTERLCEYM